MTFELDAQNTQTGQRIIERFLDDGTRFFKHIPFHPLIFVKLKEQFKDKNVIVEMGSNKWIRISKTGENPELKDAARQSIGKEDITQKDIMNMEVEMLKKSGFMVQTREMQDEKSN